MARHTGGSRYDEKTVAVLDRVWDLARVRRANELAPRFSALVRVMVPRSFPFLWFGNLHFEMRSAVRLSHTIHGLDRLGVMKLLNQFAT